MSVQDELDKLRVLARNDEELKNNLLSTRNMNNPVSEFCKAATSVGCEISAMELILAGEEAYAAPRRSTNGGGENAPLLKGEDDLYEMFLIELEN